MVKRVNSILFITTLLLLVSCSKPDSFYQFKDSVKDYRDSGLVSYADFEYPIEDTKENYSLYIVLKYNALELKLDSLTCAVHHKIDDTIPHHSDTLLLMPKNALKAKRSGSIVDIEWQICNNFSFDKAGKWKTTLEIYNYEAAKAINGLGYSYRKE